LYAETTAVKPITETEQESKIKYKNKPQKKIYNNNNNMKVVLFFPIRV
jgi:hypothetical protein